MGARQESDGSCGPAFWSALPEVLKTTTEFCAAESNDGVGALLGPVHTGTFEACANGHLASGLDNARGRAQTLGVELWIAHTLAIGQEIMETATSQIGARDLAADGVEQSQEFSGIEFFLAAFCPLSSPWGGRTVQSFSHITQVLFGMIAVNNLGGIGKLIVGDVPNPQSPIPEHDGTRGLAEAAARSFSPDALGEGRTCRRGIQRTGTLQGR